jgi:NTE family protein
MKVNKRLKYALVLSGGGAKGLAHVGFLCALEDSGYPPPSLIAGTSMGAVIGGLYASGMSGQVLRRHVLEELDLPDIMESPVFRMDGPIGKIFRTGQIVGNAATRPGIDSGKKVLRLLERLSEHKNIEDCDIPFICNAVDIGAGQEVIFRSGSLARAIRASMSFPFVFEPFVENGQYLADGGVINNLPVKSAREAGRALGIRRILAVDAWQWQTIPENSLKNGVSVVMRCFDVMAHIFNTGKESEKPHLLIRASDKTSAFDFSRKRELVELGEAAAAESKDELDAFFGRGVRNILTGRKKITSGIELEEYYGRYGGIHA